MFRSQHSTLYNRTAVQHKTAAETSYEKNPGWGKIDLQET